MSESAGRLTNVFIYEYMPREWHCREIATGITAMGASRGEVLDGFRAIWNDRAPFHLIEHAPPRPRRPDESTPTSAAIEGDIVAVIFHRLLVREFHSDHHPGKSYTGDQVLTAVNRLWNQARAKV